MDVAGPFCAHCTVNHGTINDLPTEILHKVFSYLNCEDLISVSKVCRVWNAAVNFVGLWNDVQWIIPKYSKPIKIETVLEYIPAVRKIIFQNGLGINCSYKILIKILKHCEDIRSLDVGYNCYINSEVLSSIIHKFPNIEELKFEGDPIYDCYILKPLQSCLHLKILEFRGRYDSLINLDPIAVGCPELTHLNAGLVKLNDTDFAKFLMAKKGKLQSLVFRAPLHNAYTIPLRECKNLDHVRCTFDVDETLTKDLLDAIASLPKLTRLGLNISRSIPSCMLRNFFDSMSSRNVVELSLKLINKMSDEFAAAIQTCCPLIKRLALRNYEGPSEDEASPFVSLLQLPHLEDLELLDFRYTESWFSQLLKCQKLRHLTLKHCFLLENQNALKLLTYLKLLYLHLSQCYSLDDLFLINFPTNVSLRHLDILECCFSERCVEQLKRQHPSIVINWSQGMMSPLVQPLGYHQNIFQ